ncbi:hypothetical protein Plhal703r1_c06g0034211 [Plasmopara halstedii]
MSPVPTTCETPSLAGSKGTRGQNPSSAEGASPDSTSAASQEAHPKPSANESNTPRPPWGTSFLVEELEEAITSRALFFQHGMTRRMKCANGATLRTQCPFPDLSTSRGEV